MDWTHYNMIAQAAPNAGGVVTLIAILVAVILILGQFVFIMKRYKRCPPNRLLVVYGKVGHGPACKIVDGGGVFVLPVVQDYAYLSLTPLKCGIELSNALSMRNHGVAAEATVSFAISSDPELSMLAAERLLGLREEEIVEQAREIVAAQLRSAIASLTTEDLEQDRSKVDATINQCVSEGLKQVGLKTLSVDIRNVKQINGDKVLVASPTGG